MTEHSPGGDTGIPRTSALTGQQGTHSGRYFSQTSQEAANLHDTDLSKSQSSHFHGRRKNPTLFQELPRRQISRGSQPEDNGSAPDEDGGVYDNRGARTSHSKSDPNAPPSHSKSDPNAPQRLLVVSSKIKNSILMQTAVLPNVTFVQYKYETATLENILSSVSQHLGSKKVVSVAMLAHSSSSAIFICGKDDRTLTADSVVNSRSLRDFFQSLIRNHLGQLASGTRFDFLATSIVHSTDGSIVRKELQNLFGIPVGLSRDVTGSDIELEQISDDRSRPMYVGELYFRMDRLRWSGTHQQSLSGFDKIRTVGKGAYGTAILYRKKDDDSLVILKEINLHDLTASERQMALNEVRVLAMLDHPNIISYYDSFEEDGVIMIEMEYADGGTLAQYLSQQEAPLSEKEILSLFAQIVSAIKFIHEHNILHRDLKTANIFLTKEGRVKVGDFGISKLMSTTNQGANTVLGTPYYISPEMCEGKPYNDKSDIWALGCILYEMACLQRTFEGSNLPALVNKIMKGQFAPVTGNYSQQFKNLVMSMLQREPEFRPSAAKVWQDKLSELMVRYNDGFITDQEEDGLASSGSSVTNQKRRTRSVLYYFEMSQMQLTPIPLRSRTCIQDVSVSSDHVIVVTVEQLVYTWGNGAEGQLGHGDLDNRNNPEIVDALKGKSIVKVCCGKGFSVFASDNGIVMTCGDGALGCLGHGDFCSTTRPRLIEALLSVDVVSISCGPQHVVAVGSEGEVFTWGCGKDGRLGLNSEQNMCQPMEVRFEEGVTIRECFCGSDGTMLLTDVGSVLACGSNEYNKLGLNHRVGFLMAMKNIFNKTEVAGEKVFCVVRALARHRVTSLHMGPNHSVVIVEPGLVYAFGRNTDGQLGTGNLKLQGGPIRIKVFEGKPAFHVQCGEYYTVAGTLDNDLLFWGTRNKKSEDIVESHHDLRLERAGSGKEHVKSAPSNSHSRQSSIASVNSVTSKESTQEINAAKAELAKSNFDPEVKPLVNDSAAAGGDISKPERQQSVESLSSNHGDQKNSSQSSLSSASFKPPRHVKNSVRTSSTGKDEPEIIFQPTPLLRLDSSGSRSQAGDTVTLSRFFCHGENLFIQVETTAPPPKRRSRKKRVYRKRLSEQGPLAQPDGSNGMSASSRDGGDEYSSEASELDNSASIPAWLKQELANSEVTDQGPEVDDTTEHSEEEPAQSMPESSMSSIHINHGMKQEPVAKKSDDRRTRGIGARYQALLNASQKAAAIESGIDSSTSSSSDSLALYTPELQSRPEKTLSSRKTTQATPVIIKSKAGPTQSQKPLNRIRAQGKTRWSDPKDSSVTRSVELKHNQESLDRLHSELEQLRIEKQRTEARLQEMESHHFAEREQLWKQAEQKASERESQLQTEIQRLRDEMQQQNTQIRDNLDVVKVLQEQLEKIQSEQARLSARPDSRQSQRDSKICVVQ